MTHSLNEIEALAKRAARGAGLSWGMAEEAAKATRWLASHNLPGVELLADVLRLNDRTPQAQVAPVSLTGNWQALSGTLCPIASGAALNDCADKLAQDGAFGMVNVSHPLLVLPFAAWAALHIDAPVLVSWMDVRIVTNGYGLWLNGPQSQVENRAPVTLTCAVATQPENAVSNPTMRGRLDRAAGAQLNTFAGRTYAPATEESRRLGAGAGVSDND
ncbi:MAG: DUF3726 domain-containing protein [Sulfitobacter sp.]